MRFPHPVYPFSYDIELHAIVGDDGRVYTTTVRPDGQRMIRCRKARCSPMRFHRLIAECILRRELTPEELVDHKDCDKGNNKPSNLRVVDQSDNQMNRVNRPKGVYWIKQRQAWRGVMQKTMRGERIRIVPGQRQDRAEAEALYAEKRAAILAHIDATRPTLADALRAG